MAEVQFAKAFLAQLDRRPVKLSSDFVSDPRKYPSQSPYTLPRPSHPFPSSTTEATSSTITITLKPTKGPAPQTHADLDPTQTTVLDLKTLFAAKAGVPLATVKILHNKRPAADLKTLTELLPSPTPATAELGVMVLGAPPAGAAHGSGPGSEESKAEETETVGLDETFWSDLHDFLIQRLKDEGEGQRLLGLFKKAAGR